MDRLEHSMRDLDENHNGIYKIFDTLVEFSTKFMHFVATTLYFLQVNKDAKDLRKERKTTHSIYGFLVEYWLKMLLKKPINVEGRM